MALRVCKGCKIEKHLETDFTRRLDSSGGLTYRWKCKICLAKISKFYRHSGTCSIDGCKNVICCRNLCHNHLYQIDEKYKNYRKKYNKSPKGRAKARLDNFKRRQHTKNKIYKKFLKQLKQVLELCPENKEADHIIPLKNENVCGLNVPWNIQFLTRSENSSKRNKFDFTNENESWRISFQQLNNRYGEK